VIDSGLGTARAEDAQGTPTLRHTSPSILEECLGGPPCEYLLREADGLVLLVQLFLQLLDLILRLTTDRQI